MVNPLINPHEPEEMKFYGIYRAKVVDHDNDELYDASVKVRVFGVHDEIEEDHLPWAIYADPFMGGLNHESTGGCFIPDEESHVWVMFEGGDHRYPVYFAGAPAIQDDVPDTPNESRRQQDDKEGEEYEFPLDDEDDFPFEEKDPADADSEYPFNRVFRTKAGFIIEIDDTEDNTRLRVKQPSGNEKVDDHDGNEEKLVKGNVSELFEENYMRRVQESVYEHVEENVERHIEGDREEHIEGNEERHIEGNREEHIEGNEDRHIESNRDEQIDGNEDREIGGNEDREIGGNFSTEVGGNYSLDVGANITIDAGGVINIEAGGPCTIQAPVIQLN